jgi:hypothetical protein
MACPILALFPEIHLVIGTLKLAALSPTRWSNLQREHQRLIAKNTYWIQHLQVEKLRRDISIQVLFDLLEYQEAQKVLNFSPLTWPAQK